MLGQEMISIELTDNEALALFHFLRKFNDDDLYEFQDQAEQRILWDIECLLEKEEYSIKLTNKEAIVLFDFLSKFDEEGVYEFQDQAEQQVLWSIEGVLEKHLPEILHPDYVRFLNEARDEVRDQP